MNSKQRSGALYLTQKVEYGITLLTELAKNKKERKSIAKIAEKRNLSFAFLQKIAGLLQQARIIEAERGKYGGYKLKKAPERLTLKTIIETLEGPIAIVPCIKSPCRKICACGIRCETKSSLQKINRELLQFFASKTLDQLIS